jgi:hypothetical protein
MLMLEGYRFGHRTNCCGSAPDLLRCISKGLLIFAGSGDDLLDKLRLGVGVVLEMRPPTRRQLSLSALVALAVLEIRP